MLLLFVHTAIRSRISRRAVLRTAPQRQVRLSAKVACQFSC